MLNTTPDRVAVAHATRLRGALLIAVSLLASCATSDSSPPGNSPDARQDSANDNIDDAELLALIVAQVVPGGNSDEANAFLEAIRAMCTGSILEDMQAIKIVVNGGGGPLVVLNSACPHRVDEYKKMNEALASGSLFPVTT